MPKYVYRTVDIQSNDVLEDIDLRNVQFSIVLNGVGDLTGDLPVMESRRGLLLDAATYPGRTGIYVLRNEIPVWGGIIWKRSWSEEDAMFRLSCGSWESYAYHILQLNTLTYTNVEQLQIARDILAKNGVQTEAGITWPNLGTSGRKRDRNLNAYEYKTVGLELEQLSALDDGFDYRVENYVKADGRFGRRYQFGYPSLGRTASLDPAANSLTFDYPGNLAPFELTEDAESGATSVFATGEGEGNAMLVAHAGDGTLGVGSIPLQTQAASALLSRMSTNPTTISNTDWTWSGCPSYVTTYGSYLKDLAKQDGVEPDVISSSKVGQVPAPTTAAQLILDRMNSGLEIFEDWSWRGAPYSVTQYNDMLVMLFYKANPGTSFPANIPTSKTWLASYIAAHPAPTTTSTTIDWESAQEWLTKYISANPAPYTFDPTPDTVYGPWPRLDAVRDYNDVSVAATLQAHADADYAEMTPPIESWTFQLAPDSDVKLTDITVGDSAVFRLSSRRWPAPKVMIRRITEIKVVPPDDGKIELVQLGLSDERNL